MNQNNLSLDEWRLIQDCVVDQIHGLQSGEKWGYEDALDRLRSLLLKIHPLGMSRI